MSELGNGARGQLGFAPAKINLSLRVLGRRADGYHLIESLVGFCTMGDDVCFASAAVDEFELTGPFAAVLGASGEPVENLAVRARDQFREMFPREAERTRGTLKLVKRLPIASGVGGGSSDAAAVLRLLAEQCALTGAETQQKLLSVAARLGADVPVCLERRGCLMGGIGERLSPLPFALPAWGIMLVNPLIPVSTADVFGALNAASCSATDALTTPPTSIEDLLKLLREVGNDLEQPAYALEPELVVCRDVVERSGQALHCGMSGSGATHFAVYEQESDAQLAAELVRAAQPDWWVQSGQLI